MRRLDLAASMIVRPRVPFVDEPTTGLDPRARCDLWQALRALVNQGSADEFKSLVGPPLILVRCEHEIKARRALAPLRTIDLHVTIDDTATSALLHAAHLDSLARSLQAVAEVASPTEVTMRKPSLDDPGRVRTGSRVAPGLIARGRNRGARPGAALALRSAVGGPRRGIRCPVRYVCRLRPGSDLAWLGTVAEFNPVSATATALRDLLGGAS